MKFSLRDECEQLVLSCGDMIIDTTCNNVGILVDRVRRISMEDDDVYFWSVVWSEEAHNSAGMPMTLQMEEEGLKLSIVIGLYDLFCPEEQR
jgi:hypothetical protein|tara:strand:+ start:3575 stop:3850 length:276 start_codon:yes stop_codon:yes gene_type:complete